MASEIAPTGLPCARSAVISRIAASNGESYSDVILRLTSSAARPEAGAAGYL
jgi:hypothetical protein